MGKGRNQEADEHTDAAKQDIDRDAVWDAAWRRACEAERYERGKSRLATPAGDEGLAIRNYAREVGVLDDAMHVGNQYNTWRHAMAIYLSALNANLTERTGGTAVGGEVRTKAITDGINEGPVVNRPACFPEVTRQKLLPRSAHNARKGLPGKTSYGGCAIEVRMLRVVRAWVKSIGKWAQGGNIQGNRTARYVVGVAAAFLRGRSGRSWKRRRRSS